MHKLFVNDLNQAVKALTPLKMDMIFIVGPLGDDGIEESEIEVRLKLLEIAVPAVQFNIKLKKTCNHNLIQLLFWEYEMPL